MQKMINQNEILNSKKDIELGEKHFRLNFHYIVSYRILAHISESQKVYYIHYQIIKNGEIIEYKRIIKKDTAILMLSRIKDINEHAITELIPYFEREKEKIQLHDRILDKEKVLTDEEILKVLNKVQYFHFFGQHVICERAYPHVPHILGFYNTVRHGSLPIYCLGRGGTLVLQNGKKVKLLITKSCLEDCIGSYILFELYE